ncbi:MAG: alpha/beta fold hydrolase [Patescibacteria group bacterium]
MLVKRVYLIHGWEGYPEEGWFPWLLEKLAAQDIKLIIPQMPNAIAPALADWVATLQEKVGQPDEKTILIGHSLGCATILHYLSHLKSEKQFKGVILVAPFVRQFGMDEVQDFVDKRLQWEHIRDLSERFVVIHSADDEVVPVEEGEYITDRLNADLIEVNDFFHFSGADNITEAPPVLLALRKCYGEDKPS